jgi:hypothetical protein
VKIFPPQPQYHFRFSYNIRKKIILSIQHDAHPI